MECDKCKLKDFCLKDKRNFFKEMWQTHKGCLPEEYREDINSNLLRKAKNRRNGDKSKYPLQCYYAVLLFQLIEDKCLDHYTGDKWEKIDWTKAKEGGKHPEAPAIDHINQGCKDPLFKKSEDGELEPNLAFCRNDVNDAKNDLTESDFIALCRAVVAFADKKQSPSGL